MTTYFNWGADIDINKGYLPTTKTPIANTAHRRTDRRNRSRQECSSRGSSPSWWCSIPRSNWQCRRWRSEFPMSMFFQKRAFTIHMWHFAFSSNANGLGGFETLHPCRCAYNANRRLGSFTMFAELHFSNCLINYMLASVRGPFQQCVHT